MARQPNAKPVAPVLNGHDDTATIEIDGDGSNEPTVEVGDQGAATVDPGIETLRKQLDEANARAANAERERDTLASARRTDQAEVADHRLLVIDSTITAKETEKRELQAAKIAAKEAGDYAAEVDADDKLQQLNIDIRQAKVGKSRLEHEIEQTKSTGRTAGGADGGDPLEEYIASANMHPRAATWLRAHREYAEDPEKNAELVLAHTRAKSRHALNSDGYFTALEEELAKFEPTVEAADTGQQQQEEQTERRAPSAPVSRAAGMGGGGKLIAEGITDLGGGKYRVSPQVAEAAAFSGITIEEYIAEAKKLTRGTDGQLH